MNVTWIALVLALAASPAAAETAKSPNSVIGARSDIAAAYAMLAHASKEARSGHMNFKVTCVDNRTSPATGTACDGAKLLRTVDLQRISQVVENEEAFPKIPANRNYWTQMVFFRVGKGRTGRTGPETLLFEITHGPGRTSKVIRSIAISLDRIC